MTERARSDLAFAKAQGFTLWRRVGEAGSIEVWRAEWGRTRVYRAFVGEDAIAVWSTDDGPGGSTSGHIRGDFSRVQGDRAPCAKLADWLEQVSLPVT